MPVGVRGLPVRSGASAFSRVRAALSSASSLSFKELWKWDN